MKTLLIYDNVGYVIQQISSSYRVPVGVPYLEVEVPEGKRVVSGIGVNVSVTPHKPILEDIPPSEIEKMRMETAATNAELFELVVSMGGGNL